MLVDVTLVYRGTSFVAPFYVKGFLYRVDNWKLNTINEPHIRLIDWIVRYNTRWQKTSFFCRELFFETLCG